MFQNYILERKGRKSTSFRWEKSMGHVKEPKARIKISYFGRNKET